MKLFLILTSGFGEEDFLRISSCPYSEKVSPPMAAMFFKNSRTIFEKGHPRNILVKLFPNQTRDFREEDFLTIFSCPYSAKSLPPPLPPCFLADQNFANEFRKGSPKE